MEENKSITESIRFICFIYSLQYSIYSSINRIYEANEANFTGSVMLNGPLYAHRLHSPHIRPSTNLVPDCSIQVLPSNGVATGKAGKSNYKQILRKNIFFASWFYIFEVFCERWFVLC